MAHAVQLFDMTFVPFSDWKTLENATTSWHLWWAGDAPTMAAVRPPLEVTKVLPSVHLNVADWSICFSSRYLFVSPFIASSPASFSLLAFPGSAAALAWLFIDEGQKRKQPQTVPGD
jgi:hypothetical protein